MPVARMTGVFNEDPYVCADCGTALTGGGFVAPDSDKHAEVQEYHTEYGVKYNTTMLQRNVCQECYHTCFEKTYPDEPSRRTK